jgi:hypothetical protein
MTEKSSPQYDYDVAISFLKQDEALALRIRDDLAPLKTFVYSKAQEELAGNDGVEAFRDVFRSRSRVALVLYRNGWGKTPWTRVEETAIKDFCLAEGWEHLFFARLERASDVPRWVPDSYIYLDFETFGVSDLVGAVKAKCARLGVELRVPTASDEARKLARAERFKEETRAARDRSAAPFQEASRSLFAALDEAVAALASGTGWEIVKGHANVYVASARGISFQLLPRKLYANTCRESELLFRIFSGRLVTPDEEERGLRPSWPPTERISNSLALNRTEAFGWCWRYAGKPRSNQETAQFVIETFVKSMDHAERWSDD